LIFKRGPCLRLFQIETIGIIFPGHLLSLAPTKLVGGDFTPLLDALGIA